MNLASFKRIIEVYHANSLVDFFKIVFERVMFLIWGTILFYPIYLLLCVLRPFKLIRFSPAPVDRIGPLAGNLGYYTCERKHGVLHNGTYDIFYYSGVVSNKQLLKMWKRVLHISYLANFFARSLQVKKPNSPHHFETRPTDKFGLRAKTESFIGFTRKEELQAVKEMKLFMPDEKAPFVCLLSRDNAYLNLINPSKDWSYHDYRNSNIESYLKAAEALESAGNIFIRMGSKVKDPFVSENPNIIDYAYKNYRSELLDLYLTVKCKMFITTGTGLDTLANIFHKPILYINFLPYFNFCFFPNVITVPKLLFSRKLERFLTFKEILGSEVWRFSQTSQYEDEEIDVIDNSPDEILDAALEMNMRLDGTWIDGPEDDVLQRKFWSLFPQTHYHAGEVQSRIGASFLRKYKYLFD